MFNISRRIFMLLFLGFASGLPIALTSSTLSAWYTEAGMSISSIGMLTLVGQPYVYKFFWAPFLDRFDIFRMGRRRSWMIATQVALGVSLFTMSLLKPETHPVLLALLAFLVACFSSTQDIAISGYLTEAPLPDERGLAVSFYNTTYRLAVIFASAIALIMAEYMGWHLTYLTMSSTMLLFIISSYFTPEPTNETPHTSLKDTFVKPLVDFVKRYGIKTFSVILILAFLYKLTDAFALSLSSVFFLRELQYSLVEVGAINKLVGIAASIFGSLLAGILMRKIKVFPALVIFGLLQAFGNLIFVWLYLGPHSLSHFGIAVFIDNFTSGLGTTAFLVFLIGLCSKQFAATQIALLTAITALGRVYMGPPAAWVVERWGWVDFFVIAVAIGVIATALLVLIRKELR